MDPEAAAFITPHLLAREELLWCGRPHDINGLLNGRGALILIVGIVALLMRWLPVNDPNLTRDPSIQLAVFVVILIAEAIVYHGYLSNTFYGVTNQRVIVVSGLRERAAAAVLLDLLNTPRLIVVRRKARNVELIPPVNPSGALPFTNPSFPPDWAGNEWCRLIAVEKPQLVYDLIVEATNKLKSQ
jgi:hypothetical protein